MTAEREAMTLERQAFEKWASEQGFDTTNFIAWLAWQAAIDAHLSRAAEPVNVPVGWAKEYGRETLVSWSKEAPEHGKGGWRPLYTHPPEPARDATFTDEAVARLARSINLNPDITLKPMKSLIAWLRGAIDAAMQANPDAKDAARYRWLATHCFDEAMFNESYDKSEVDDRIDAVMAQESGDE